MSSVRIRKAKAQTQARKAKEFRKGVENLIAHGRAVHRRQVGEQLGRLVTYWGLVLAIGAALWLAVVVARRLIGA